jgi:cell pole-organizing protein PopZ
MAVQEQQSEPSMEEILASIRRIISEEEQPDTPPAPVLDLTRTAPAEGEDDLVFEASEEIAAEPASIPEQKTPPMPVALTTAPAANEPPIISQPTASAAAGAFAAAGALARLAGTLRIADTPGQTIEGVVRELLKPMLREWFDEHLPAIVEARVEAELERIARMAR